jgi:hypothetical protein
MAASAQLLALLVQDQALVGYQLLMGLLLQNNAASELVVCHSSSASPSMHVLKPLARAVQTLCCCTPEAAVQQPCVRWLQVIAHLRTGNRIAWWQHTACADHQHDARCMYYARYICIMQYLLAWTG